MGNKDSLENVKSIVFGTIIYVPAGKCPYKLEGTDEESVIIWMRKVQKAQKPGVQLETNAFKYWVRHTYDVFSAEYKDALKMIDLISAAK